MNRQIKFRGISVKTREWVYGYYSVFTYESQGGDFPRDETGHFIMPIKGDNEQTENDEYIRVIPESVGQFTGLRDNWKNEIWEHDRVKILYTDWPSKVNGDPRTIDQYLDDIAMTAVVIFAEGAFELEYSSGSYGSIHPGAHGFIKVIGSIHTTPELLKQNV